MYKRGYEKERIRDTVSVLCININGTKYNLAWVWIELLLMRPSWECWILDGVSIVANNVHTQHNKAQLNTETAEDWEPEPTEPQTARSSWIPACYVHGIFVYLLAVRTFEWVVKPLLARHARWMVAPLPESFADYIRPTCQVNSQMRMRLSSSHSILLTLSAVPLCLRLVKVVTLCLFLMLSVSFYYS